METQTRIFYDLTDNDAPENKELLIERVFDGIMKLTDEEKILLLSKYAERHGWKL